MAVHSSQMFHDPQYLIALIRSEDGSWTAMGSRKLGRLEVQMQTDFFYGALDTWDWDRKSIYKDHIYDISTQAANFTYVKGTTQLAALGALLDHFREEEEKEAEEKKRQADRARFGGEVNEELIRKVVRWRKKQAKKTQEYLEDYADEY